MNASDVQLRTSGSSQQLQSQMSSNAGAGNGTNGTSSGAGRGGVNQYLYDPFDVLLAATLEYGRAGQYSYFYTGACGCACLRLPCKQPPAPFMPRGRG